MKKLESSLLNMVLVLTGVAVVMGGILAFVNHLTEGPIAQQKEKTLADVRSRTLRARTSAQLSRAPRWALAAT